MRVRDYFPPSAWPPLTDGLSFYTPLTRDHGTVPIHSAAGSTGLSTETVDGDGTYTEAYSDLIVGASANTARVGKDGMVSEVASQNELTRSYTYAHGDWTKSGTSAASDATAETLDPQGGSNASKITGIGAIGDSDYMFQNISITNSAEAGVGVWIKRISTAGVLNLQNSAAGAASGDWDVDMSALPDEWVRLTPSSPYVTVVAGFNADGAGNLGVLFVRDSGASKLSFYLWNSQVEDNGVGGSNAPTTDIPTVAAAVTRAKEDLRYSNAGEAHLDNAAGTIIFAVTPDYDASHPTLTVPFSAVEADFTDGVRFEHNQGVSKWRFVVRSGNAEQAALASSSGASNGTPVVLAGVYAANDARLYTNGADEQADTSVTVPVGMNTTMYPGQARNGANQLNGKIQHLLCYNRALTAAEILQVTQWIQGRIGAL